MNKKSNRQYHKTEVALQNALVCLLKHKSLDNITVTELTQKADVHRGTFYIHYKDVYDLFESVENDFFTKTQELYILYVGKAKEVDLITFFSKIYEIFHENIQVTKLLLDKGSFEFDEAFIFLKAHEYRGPASFKEWRSIYSIGDKDNYLYFFTSLVAAVNTLVFAWFENDFEKTPHEIASITAAILKGFGFKKPIKDMHIHKSSAQ